MALAGGSPWHSHFSGIDSHECFNLMSSQRGEIGVVRPSGTAARTDSTESQYMFQQFSRLGARTDEDTRTA
jgi:hypothetical protein